MCMASGFLRPSPAIEGGVDSLFHCWRRVPSTRVGLEEEFQPCRASEYWWVNYDEARYTDFSESVYLKPRGLITVSLRSRSTFTYGNFALMAKLPRVEGGPILWFGFEHDDLFAGGVVHFSWFSGRGSLYANIGGASKVVSMDLTKFLPKDASDRYHWYSVVYRRGVAMWFIDNRLRAIASVASGEVKDGGVVYDESPYVVAWTTDAPSAQLAVLIDIDGAPDVEFRWVGLNPWGLRVSNGDPKVPVKVKLYRAGSETTWAGSVVKPGDEFYSQPLPGMGRKTLLLNVPGGELTMEYFADGEWVEAKRGIQVSGTVAMSIIEDAPLIRFRYRAREQGSVRVASMTLT